MGVGKEHHYGASEHLTGAAVRGVGRVGGGACLSTGLAISDCEPSRKRAMIIVRYTGRRTTETSMTHVGTQQASSLQAKAPG